MDPTGYDAVWLAEHHFSRLLGLPFRAPDGRCMSADRTKRLRIGTAVTLAAFYHPLRIAEEVALLDVLSGGRVNWGAGRGFDRTEFKAFGMTARGELRALPRARRHRAAGMDERQLTYHGEYWDFDDVEVLPKPLQRPTRRCGWRRVGSARSTGRSQGYSILMDPHSSHAEIGSKRALLRGARAPPATAPAGQDIPVARLLAVAPTDGEAEDIARNGAAWTVGAYANPAKRSIVSADATEAGPPGHQVDPVAPLRRRRDHLGFTRPGRRQARRAARDDRPRLPHVRPPQPRQLHPLHRAGPPQAPLDTNPGVLVLLDIEQAEEPALPEHRKHKVTVVA